jgi:transposase-like protein
MRRGRPKAPLTLTGEERETLTHWATRPVAAAPLAERAKILLACAGGETNKSVAREFSMTPQTVGKWRARFLRHRLDGLLDEPRTGAPRRILDADVQRVLTLTLESSAPRGLQWSTRSLAQATGLSQSAISRIWRAHGLRPYRGESSRFWHDPRFVAQVRDVAGLYADPPTFALALCVSARSLPSVDRVQPSPARSGELGRDTRRTGPDSLLSRLRLPPGRLRSVEERRARTCEFRQFLEALDASVPRGLDVHVLVARDGTHESSIVQSWLAGRPRFQAHPIAPRTSFDDLVERWLSILGKRRPEGDPDAPRRPLEAAAARHAAEHASAPAPFVWVKPAEEIARFLVDY